MQKSLPEHITEYLNPLMSRIQALQQKNTQLQTQILRIMTSIQPPKDNLKSTNNKEQSIPSKNNQKILPTANKTTKQNPIVQKKLPNDEESKITQIHQINQPKVQEKLLTTPKIQKVNPIPKKQQRDRIVSTKITEQKSVKELPKKEDIKKVSGLNTPVGGRKNPKIDTKVVQEKIPEKIEVIIQTLELAEEVHQKQEQKQIESPIVLISNSQNLEMGEKQKIQKVPDNIQQPIVKATKPNTQSKIPIHTKTSVQPAKIKNQPKLATTENKSKKIEGEVKNSGKVITSKTQIKGNSTKNLKENNKAASNTNLPQTINNKPDVQDLKKQVEMKIEIKQSQDTQLQCNQVLEFKKQNLT